MVFILGASSLHHLQAPFPTEPIHFMVTVICLFVVYVTECSTDLYFSVNYESEVDQVDKKSPRKSDKSQHESTKVRA